MLYEYYNTEFYDMLELYVNRIFETLTQKSVILLIIQGITLAFSAWDKNSRLFVILANIGVYSVYGSISMWISIRRRVLEERKLEEYRKKQYDRSIDVRREEQLYSELFIPVKEQAAAEKPDNKFYYMNNSKLLYLQ